MAGENRTGNQKIPTVQELYDLFREFLQKWSGLPMQKADADDDEIPLLPLELGLMFFEPQTGILETPISKTSSEILGLKAGGW